MRGVDAGGPTVGEGGAGDTGRMPGGWEALGKGRVSGTDSLVWGSFLCPVAPSRRGVMTMSLHPLSSHRCPPLGPLCRTHSLSALCLSPLCSETWGRRFETSLPRPSPAAG